MLKKLEANLQTNTEDTENLKNREEQLELLIGKHHETLIAHNRRMNSLKPQAIPITIPGSDSATTPTPEVETGSEDTKTEVKDFNMTSSFDNGTKTTANNSMAIETTEKPSDPTEPTETEDIEGAVSVNVEEHTESTNLEIDSEIPKPETDDEVTENTILKKDEENSESSPGNETTKEPPTSSNLNSKVLMKTVTAGNSLPNPTSNSSPSNASLQPSEDEEDDREGDLEADLENDNEGDHDEVNKGEDFTIDSSKTSIQDKENLEDNSKEIEDNIEEKSEVSLEGSAESPKSV